MFDNIDDKIKGFAKFVFIVGIIVGGIWLAISCYTLFSYRDFLKYTSLIGSGHESKYIIKAFTAKSQIPYSIALIIGSYASSILLCGFGEIIETLNIISNKLADKDSKETNNIFDKMKEVKESKAQLNDSIY
jgi:hypothetical protein